MKRRSFLAAAVGAVLAPFTPGDAAAISWFKSIGGPVRSAWPEGCGYEYHFYSPLIVEGESFCFFHGGNRSGRTNAGLVELARKVVADDTR